mmetsp:Transcript_41375/g.88876  ORF Transcript_41375/g.88876 Transcript_41375/m.88876 type:complete len:236 (+) Transcript_41375:172-879(+)
MPQVVVVLKSPPPSRLWPPLLAHSPWTQARNSSRSRPTRTRVVKSLFRVALQVLDSSRCRHMRRLYRSLSCSLRISSLHEGGLHNRPSWRLRPFPPRTKRRVRISPLGPGPPLRDRRRGRRGWKEERAPQTPSPRRSARALVSKTMQSGRGGVASGSRDPPKIINDERFAQTQRRIDRKLLALGGRPPKGTAPKSEPTLLLTSSHRKWCRQTPTNTLTTWKFEGTGDSEQTRACR